MSDLPKIPSQYKEGQAGPRQRADSSRRDVDLVTLDVAVLDNKGHFIPGIPAGNFRVLEDNVPQQITKVRHGRSAHDHRDGDRVQQPVPAMYCAAAWFQTLQLAWGFASTL